MFRLAVLSLRNRAVVALVALAIMAAGVAAVGALKRELIPSLDIPMAAVIASYPGSSPAVVSAQVTDPIEAAVRGVSGATSIESTSSTGLSTTIVSFDYGTDMDQANQRLAAAVNRVSAALPSSVETQIVTGSMDDFPILRLSVTGGDDPAAVAAVVTDVLVPRLRDLADVRAVDVHGYTADVITVAPDAAAMAQYGVTTAQILSVLRDNGLTVPVGTVAKADKTISVQIGNPVTTAEQLENLPLTIYQPPAPDQPTPSRGATPTPGPLPEPVTVTLGLVTNISLAPETVTSYSRFNGEAAIDVAVTKTPAGNTVDVAAAVDEVLADLAGVLAERGCAAQVSYSQAPFIEQSIESLATEGLIGLAACIAVILLFLLSLRATLVSAVSIPLSILAVFIGLRLTGGTLNILTIGAIAIAIGRVVDDSIVVIENIRRHLTYGEDKLPAITASVREVAGAVAASTVCTVAVFLPMAFVTGLVGELFTPFAATVAISLAASLVVALTIVPVLAYWFVKRPVVVDAADAERQRAAAEAKERRSPLQRGYLGALRAALAHPVVTVVLAAFILGGTAWFARGLETNFLGAQGQDTVTATLAFPPNTSLAAQDAGAKQVEEMLSQFQGDDGFITAVQTTVGAAGSLAALGSAGQPTASFALTVTPESAADAPARIRQALAGLNPAVGAIEVSDGSSMMGSTTVDLVIRSDDSAHLADAAAAVEAMAAALPETAAVGSNLSASQELYEIRVDRVRALSFGLTESQVASLVASLVQPVQIGSVSDGGTTTAVQVSLGASPGSLENLMGLPVATTPAGPVTLGQVATAYLVDAPAAITTSQGKRSATVSVTPAGTDLGALTTALTAGLAGLDPAQDCDPLRTVCLPEGVTVEISGLAQLQADAFGDLGLALLIAIAVVYIVMVAAFGSLLQPFILLISIPFAATGALIALLASGTPLGVAPLIGLLMLVGIVVSNAIVLIDLINQYRRRGLSVQQAIEDGARQRLRPILMTAAATVLALLPMALGVTGHSSFLSQPLALVVIGGLVSSTVLTLVVVPTLYRVEALAHDHRGVRREAAMARRRQERAESLGLAAGLEDGAAGGNGPDGETPEDGDDDGDTAVPARGLDGAAAGRDGVGRGLDGAAGEGLEGGRPERLGRGEAASRRGAGDGGERGSAGRDPDGSARSRRGAGGAAGLDWGSDDVAATASRRFLNPPITTAVRAFGAADSQAAAPTLGDGASSTAGGPGPSAAASGDLPPYRVTGPGQPDRATGDDSSWAVPGGPDWPGGGPAAPDWAASDGPSQEAGRSGGADRPLRDRPGAPLDWLAAEAGGLAPDGASGRLDGQAVGERTGSFDRGPQEMAQGNEGAAGGLFKRRGDQDADGQTQLSNQGLGEVALAGGRASWASLGDSAAGGRPGASSSSSAGRSGASLGFGGPDGLTPAGGPGGSPPRSDLESPGRRGEPAAPVDAAATAAEQEALRWLAQIKGVAQAGQAAPPSPPRPTRAGRLPSVPSPESARWDAGRPAAGPADGGTGFGEPPATVGPAAGTAFGEPSEMGSVDADGAFGGPLAGAGFDAGTAYSESFTGAGFDAGTGFGEPPARAGFDAGTAFGEPSAGGGFDAGTGFGEPPAGAGFDSGAAFGELPAAAGFDPANAFASSPAVFGTVSPDSSDNADGAGPLTGETESAGPLSPGDIVRSWRELPPLPNPHPFWS
ncbi:MAG: efflux RND transporter permease subunit [Propionibacteriaceae bacterium]|nr:efflux RND transporter permease subunit [Propionibacteriaceae bacterium]